MSSPNPLTPKHLADRSVRALCRYGNLWKFSTAKLESRGKRMKKTARKQSSNRRTSTATMTIIKKTKRGGIASKSTKKPQAEFHEVRVKGYSGNKCKSMIGKTSFREDMIFNTADNGPNHRKAEELMSLGKQDVARKVKLEKDDRWKDLIPSDVERSVLGLLAAMASGRMKPL